MSPGEALMRGWVAEWPRQLRLSLGEVEARGWRQRFEALDARALVLGGMGGSGVAGRLALSVLDDQLPLPALLVQEAILPRFVGEGTVVLAVSYSGETWEVIDLFRSARSRGAVGFVVASGGTLSEAAERDHVFAVPAGYGPRAALGHLFPPVFSALSALAGFDPHDALLRAANLLEEEIALWASANAYPGRDPIAIAERLDGRRIHLHAPGERARVAALRWKTQFNENAKRMAVETTFPELTHNEVVGYEDQHALAETTFVLLEDPELSEGRRRVMLEATAVELRRAGAELLSVPARGANRLERLLSHLLLGDQVSVELASRRQLDPTSIPPLDRIKAAIQAANSRSHQDVSKGEQK